MQYFTVLKFGLEKELDALNHQSSKSLFTRNFVSCLKFVNFDLFDTFRHGITAYSSHSGPDAGLFSGQISYSNPYESYPSYHSDINSHHYGSDIVSSDPYPTDAAAIAGSDIPPSGSGSIYRRNGGRQKRQINQDEPVTAQDEFIGTINPTGYDFTELIFTVLGVNTPQCRKRFTCEVDFMARRDPLIQIGFRFLG